MVLKTILEKALGYFLSLDWNDIYSWFFSTWFPFCIGPRVKAQSIRHKKKKIDITWFS
jgi:hypothetical protein